MASIEESKKRSVDEIEEGEIVEQPAKRLKESDDPGPAVAAGAADKPDYSTLKARKYSPEEIAARATRRAAESKLKGKARPKKAAKPDVFEKTTQKVVEAVRRRAAASVSSQKTAKAVAKPLPQEQAEKSLKRSRTDGEDAKAPAAKRRETGLLAPKSTNKKLGQGKSQQQKKFESTKPAPSAPATAAALAKSITSAAAVHGIAPGDVVLATFARSKKARKQQSKDASSRNLLVATATKGISQKVIQKPASKLTGHKGTGAARNFDYSMALTGIEKPKISAPVVKDGAAELERDEEPAEKTATPAKTTPPQKSGDYWGESESEDEEGLARLIGTTTRKTPAAPTPELGPVIDGYQFPIQRSKFVGLTNSKNACFSNSILQALDTALAGYDPAELFGRFDELDDFGVDEKEALQFSKERTLGDSKAKGAKGGNLDKTLRESIKSATGTDDVSISKQLGKLLNYLRKEAKENDYASPYVFQQVFALHEKGSAHGLEFDGSTQQDAHEYYLALLRALIEEDKTHKRTTISDLFQIKTAQVIRCSNEQCKHEHPSGDEVYLHWDVKLPDNLRGRDTCTFDDCLRESLKDEALEGYSCEDCKSTGTSVKMTVLKTLPDNLVVRVGRDRYSGEKISNAMTLNHGLVDMDGQKYRLAVVVKHKAINRKGGHYFSLVRNTDKWYEIDDQIVSKQALRQDAVEDSSKGQSSLLLLQKVKKVYGWSFTRRLQSLMSGCR